MKKIYFATIALFAAVMMSCGGNGEAGDKAKDTTTQPQEQTEATTPAPEASASSVSYEKTGVALLDDMLEKISQYVVECQKAETKEAKQAVVDKATKEIEQWQKANEKEGEKIDPAALEKFEGEYAKLATQMMKEVGF